MSSGTYFPKAVKGVEIPKKNGKKRLLGIPTIEDRIAQVVVKMEFEPKVKAIFCNDSYGYRPNRSANDAIGIIRRYADDAVIHFQSKGEVDKLLKHLKGRLKECKLEIHPDKTRIVYCRSDKFNGRYEHGSFDFLGYTFKRRYVKSRYRNFFNALRPL